MGNSASASGVGVLENNQPDYFMIHNNPVWRLCKKMNREQWSAYRNMISTERMYVTTSASLMLLRAEKIDLRDIKYLVNRSKKLIKFWRSKYGKRKECCHLKFFNTAVRRTLF